MAAAAAAADAYAAVDATAAAPAAVLAESDEGVEFDDASIVGSTIGSDADDKRGKATAPALRKLPPSTCCRVEAKITAMSGPRPCKCGKGMDHWVRMVGRGRRGIPDCCIRGCTSRGDTVRVVQLRGMDGRYLARTCDKHTTLWGDMIVKVGTLLASEESHIPLGSSTS